MPKNPHWTREELILALDLYFLVDFSKTKSESKETKELSIILNQLPIHKQAYTDEKFRNPSGVYMKLCNFLRLDPEYPGKGLDAGSKLEEEVWNEFANDQKKLHETANQIKQKYRLILQGQ